MAAESIAYQRALAFAKRIVHLCRHLNEEHREYVLSKQILRSGTSIGANIAETLYWLELLFSTEYLTEEEYTSLRNDCQILYRMLSATTKNVRE